MTIVPLPMLRMRRAWVEKCATRIFAGVASASRPKVYAEIVAAHRAVGVDLAQAEADADATMRHIEARIALLRIAAATPIELLVEREAVR